MSKITDNKSGAEYYFAEALDKDNSGIRIDYALQFAMDLKYGEYDQTKEDIIHYLISKFREYTRFKSEERLRLVLINNFLEIIKNRHPDIGHEKCAEAAGLMANPKFLKRFNIKEEDSSEVNKKETPWKARQLSSRENTLLLILKLMVFFIVFNVGVLACDKLTHPYHEFDESMTLLKSVYSSSGLCIIGYLIYRIIRG